MKEIYEITLTSIDHNGFTPWFQIEAPSTHHSKLESVIREAAIEKDMHVEFRREENTLFFRSREGRFYTLRNCEGCGKPFFANTRRNTRCKKGCGRKSTNRNKSRNEKRKQILSTPRYCLQCRKEFLPSTTRQKYCSKSCGRKHWKEKNAISIYGNPQFNITEE